MIDGLLGKKIGMIQVFDEGRRLVPVTVIEAGPEYKELAVNQLDDGFMASPAVSGDALFLRTKSHLYRIENN